MNVRRISGVLSQIVRLRLLERLGCALSRRALRSSMLSRLLRGHRKSDKPILLPFCPPRLLPGSTEMVRGHLVFRNVSLLPQEYNHRESQHHQTIMFRVLRKLGQPPSPMWNPCVSQLGLVYRKAIRGHQAREKDPQVLFLGLDSLHKNWE